MSSSKGGASGAGGKWLAKKTIDGMDYYYNTSSKALTWDKPDALKTAEEKKIDDQNLAWVPDDNQCFVEGRILKEESNGKVTLVGTNGKTVTVKKGQVGDVLVCFL